MKVTIDKPFRTAMLLTVGFFTANVLFALIIKLISAIILLV